MKVGVYFCNCGSNISERIDAQKIASELSGEIAWMEAGDFACSEEGQESLVRHLAEHRPDRVVVAACSPREHEATFQRVLERAGMNPWLLQMVNIREQVAWVTPDPELATRKAARWIRGASARVRRHEPLETREVEASGNVLIIGAGPAGLKAALLLAEAGRKVVLVEKTPVLGGMPVRYEDLFPNMECGPCMLEPVLGEVMHGPHASNLEILTLAEVTEVTGYYGNFTAKIRQAPRHVDVEKCIGCGECIAPCPASSPNEFNYGLDERKAMSLAFAGALPNAPFLDEAACVRWKGEDCQACLDACPVEDTVLFHDGVKHLERTAGAIIVAIGSALYSCAEFSALGHRAIPGVYTSLEFERLLASNGPTAGELRAPGGGPPSRVAIIHCVGSLDEKHRPYCSGVCCQYAFKFNHLVRKKLPEAAIVHFYKELCVPGKEEFALYEHARQTAGATFVRYTSLADLRVVTEDDSKAVIYRDAAGAEARISADVIVLCPAVVGPADAAQLGATLDISPDRFGFFEELHSRLDSAQSKMKGIYLAGACQAPMDIQKSINQGLAAAGYVLSGLVEGKRLRIDPITASVDEPRCSGCRTCGAVCPYKAIGFLPDSRRATVNALLCQGCGTCVAACPAGAIQGAHFANAQIYAEMEALLQ